MAEDHSWILYTEGHRVHLQGHTCTSMMRQYQQTGLLVVSPQPKGIGVSILPQPCNHTHLKGIWTMGGGGGVLYKKVQGSRVLEVHV